MVKRSFILIVPLLVVFTSYSMQPIHRRLFECLQVIDEEIYKKELTQEEKSKELCSLTKELQQIEEELSNKIDEQLFDIHDINEVWGRAQKLFFGSSEGDEQARDRRELGCLCKERPELFDIACMTLLRGILYSN